ncbi:MAG: hypothetical protein AB7N76_21570 [Planctomycetota bacterium]
MSSPAEDSLWQGRLERLSDLVSVRLQALPARRRARLDPEDLLQDALAAWVEAGVVRGELVSPAALRTIDEALEAARVPQPLARPSRAERVVPPPDDEVAAQEELDLVLAAADELKPRVREVLLSRALLQPRPTQRALAARFGVSVSRIGILEREAERRLHWMLGSGEVRRRLAARTGWLPLEPAQARAADPPAQAQPRPRRRRARRLTLREFLAAKERLLARGIAVDSCSLETPPPRARASRPLLSPATRPRP